MIFNHARYTEYGNIQLMVTYYSHRGAKIGSERFTHYPTIKPGEQGHYAFSLQPPPPPQDAVNEIVVTIINAFATEK